MKFSYKLLKKLVPQIKSKKDAIEKLNLHSFEAAESGGDVLDIILPPNRYDAASHIGIGRELSAIYGKKFKIVNPKINPPAGGIKNNYKIIVKDKKLCPRYSAQYFELGKIKQTPIWMKKILSDCGLRPINPVVDIMNYVMLETGQPMHAFDFDKLPTKGEKAIIIRRAKSGEKISTLDNQHFILDKNTLVIADNKKVLAIAGIKGGRIAEVDETTKKIIVESANFDPISIFLSSKKLKLTTDASMRFSRGISPGFTIEGINRAKQLLEEICGVQSGKVIDIYSYKQPKIVLKFDVVKFNKFIGADFSLNQARKYLELLGFETKKSKSSPLISHPSLLIYVPYWRLDIESHEDLFEEVIRLYGYNNLKSKAPHLHLMPSGFEDEIVLEDKIKKVLTGLGLDEVQNRSFVDSGFSFGPPAGGDNYRVVELENPISKEFEYLRPNLTVNMLKNIEYNSRYLNEISIFETGKIFFKAGSASRRTNAISEIHSVGIVLASKNNEKFFELKGLVEELFSRIGLVDYSLVDAEHGNWTKEFTKAYLKPEEILKIESSGKTIGYLGKAKVKGNLANWKISVVEFDLEEALTLIEGEHEYLPLPKYPSVMRDISILVDKNKKVGDIMQSIQVVDLEHIEDVDLMDEYEDESLGGKKSLTFRIVFQAKDRTLTDEEVNKETKTIELLLKNEFGAEIR